MNRQSRIVLTAVAVVVMSTLPVSPAAAGHRCGDRAATIVGTAGADTLYGTEGDDVIVGLAGRDVIYGRGGIDRICGGSQSDRILGGSGKDRLYGEDGDDTIRGSIGRDSLRGGRGDDALYGQRGHDTIVLGGPEEPESTGTDTISGGRGRDTLKFYACARTAGHAKIDLSAGTFRTPLGHGTLAGIHIVYGSQCRDHIIGNSGDNYLRGYELGNRPDPDIFEGRGGNDTLVPITSGRSTATTVHGGSGDDAIWLMPQYGTVFKADVAGGAGSDTMTFFSDGAHADLTRGTFSMIRSTDDEASGTVNGVENLSGQGGGNGGPDVFIGDAQPNVIFGEGGADKIYGRGGDDTLNGDASYGDYYDDEVWGGAGFDTVSGGDPRNDGGTNDICAGEIVLSCEDIRVDTQDGA